MASRCQSQSGQRDHGTQFGIRLDEDGLLLAGEPGVQLTWMDAKVGDWVVTPRHGKPVEIEALWYNTLRIMEDLAERFDKANDRAHYGELAARAKESFDKLFWNESEGCLYDVVSADSRNTAIRPNQIFAVSLFHGMLSRAKAKSVVSVVQRHLLTPFGLRSLAPSDPQYRGRYGGNPYSRDSAYHQGTVWPWLIGPYLTAFLNVNARSSKARKQAARWLEEFRRYIGEKGVGQVPEVFHGDAPHRAGGCLAQAWSVAELLRCVVEEIPAASLFPDKLSLDGSKAGAGVKHPPCSDKREVKRRDSVNGAVSKCSLATGNRPRVRPLISALTPSR